MYVYHLENVTNPLETRDNLLGLDGKLSIFDADRIICSDQIRSAIDRSLRAEEQGVMIANNWGVEVLLHLSGNHQIHHAIKLLAISEVTKRIILISENPSIEFHDIIPGFPEFAPNENLFKLYGLSGYVNPCDEIISKGVQVIIDHE